MALPKALVLSGLLAVSRLLQGVDGISLSVSKDGGNASSPILYGFMFEVYGHVIPFIVFRFIKKFIGYQPLRGRRDPCSAAAQQRIPRRQPRLNSLWSGWKRGISSRHSQPALNGNHLLSQGQRSVRDHWQGRFPERRLLGNPRERRHIPQLFLDQGRL